MRFIYFNYIAGYGKIKPIFVETIRSNRKMTYFKGFEKKKGGFTAWE